MTILLYAVMIAAIALAASWVGHVLIKRVGYSARWIVGLMVGALLALAVLSFAVHSKAFRQHLLGKPAVTAPVAPATMYKMPTKPRGDLIWI